MSDKLDRFVTLMKGIFELDKSDLDFGIYRIMNIRKAEIEKFLSEGLPEKVKETLAPFAKADSSKILGRISEIEAQLGDSLATLPDTVPMVKEYNELKAQLAQGVDLGALESDVYSCLYNFFSRYYDEGDFISKRRYKEGVYAIPYEGEEVKLYWANQDQYYIKTSENFKDYTFIVDEFTVHFRIVDATTEQNYNKESDDKKRKFMLFTEDEENFPGIQTFEFDDEHKEFIIRFIYDIPTDPKTKFEELNYDKISDFIVKESPSLMQALLRPIDHPKDKKYTVLKRHLNAYIAKNTFDYFIHKDLKGFLSRELDFFIKSEVMHLDDLDTTDEKRVESYLAKVRAIKRVGKDIIDFLAQIENFQKKLWLKKKFVIETNWCITLDRIDESLWEEIRTNKTQVQEWIDMYAIDEIAESLTSVGFTNPPSIEFLRQNQNLVVDTRCFDFHFKERLIASLDNLDEQTNGLLIKGDNFHALKLLMQCKKGKIKAVSIDPPYNTEEDRNRGKFCYKDNFEDSSWMAMMFDRCSLLKQLQSSDGLSFIMIGDDECYNLKGLMDILYGKNNFKANIIWNSRKSKQNDIDVSLAHNYVLTYSVNKTKNEFYGEALIESEFSNPDNDPKGKWKTAPLDAPGVRERTSFFPIVNPNTGKEFYPPKGRHWTIFEEEVQEYIESGQIYFGAKGVTKPQWKRYWSEVSEDSKTVSTIWDEVDTATDATKELENILGIKAFDTPKPVSLIKKIIQQSCKGEETIIDVFAGSATTGHAIINANREDDGKRKYIMAEMGAYMEVSTIPRMKKVIYSADWKNGKPQSRNSGASHIMKYINLESYEDALSNIVLDEQKHTLLSMFGDEYLINYMLDTEAEGSLLDIDAFKAPFDYKLKVTENNETKTKNVDIVETFNYLIGLTVQSISATTYFNAEKDDNGEYEGAVKLIKNDYGKYGFKLIEGTTQDGKRVLVIWRTISEDLIESNAALDAYFTKYRINPLERSYDTIYVNGDNNLQNICNEGESWKVQMTELEFKKRMFEEE